MRLITMPEVTTQRLRLRRLEAKDAQAFFEFAGSGEVCRYMNWNVHKSVEESERSIQASLARYESGPYYRWGIALRATDRLIGIIQLLGFDEQRGSCSFAYMLAKDHWGQGYGTEALMAVFSVAFEAMDMDLIEADHYSMNTASGRVMEKAGMRWVGTIPGKYEKEQLRYDAQCYILTREEWIRQNKG